MTAPTSSARSAAGWLLDEVSTAGRENLDATHVARYDGKENAGASEEVDLLRTHGLDERWVVVDLGAGTGQFASAVAPHCRRVVAVDVSPVMLDRLRTKVADQHLDNVEVVQAGFLTYDHSGEPADFVYSRYALHHLPDAWKAIALTRIRHSLRTGGLLRSGTRSTTSHPRTPRRSSRRGARPVGTASSESGAAPSSRSTSAMSTRPSPGCWS